MINQTFIWALGVLAFVGFLIAVRPAILGSRPGFVGVCVSISVLVLLFWLSAIRASQFAPHFVTSRMGREIMFQDTVTNPAYLTFNYSTEATATGLVIHAQSVTNYYWHVWGIFK